MRLAGRAWIFAVWCLIAISIPVAYLVFGVRPGGPPAAGGTGIETLSHLDGNQRGILFRSAAPDDTFGKVGFLPGGAAGAAPSITNLTCDRVYFAGGRGVCLTIEPTLVPPYAVSFFDRDFHTAGKQPLTGVPSRTRLSSDGRHAASTVFETGHSYAENGFSTRTILWDTVTARAAGDLEEFAVTRDGAPFKAPDFNFWGVTFIPDSARFYATLRTAGKIYLVEGNLERRSVQVLREGVECPSLSPDAKRLAFKKRVNGRIDVFWQPAILDLASGEERLITTESRSVDDQVEWLDDGHILYHLPSSKGADIWSLAIDNSQPPQLLIPGGYSPAVIR
jgi:hypothetical protein